MSQMNFKVKQIYLKLLGKSHIYYVWDGGDIWSPTTPQERAEHWLEELIDEPACEIPICNNVI